MLGITNRDGVFAEYTTLPIENLHRVPASVPDEAAVFTEPLAAALEIQQQTQIKPTDRVLLIGVGRLGQLIAQTLSLTGCDLRVVARHPHSTKIIDRARHSIDYGRSNPAAPLWTLWLKQRDRRMDLIWRVKPFARRGTLVMKSTYKGEMNVDFSSIVVDELTILGSRCGPFEPALRLLEKKEVDPTVLIARRFKLSEAVQAFDEAAKAGMLKVLLEA